MSNQLDPGKSCQIVVADLFAMINARRKLFSMDPVEQRAMASRCTLRFNLERKRGVDFGNEKIAVAPQDMLALESMVNDQFGVNFEALILIGDCLEPKIGVDFSPLDVG